MRLFLSSLILFYASFQATYAQKKLTKQIVQNRVTINTPDSTMIAFLYPDKKEQKVDDEKLYYWYKAERIRTSRGGYEGKLLHGKFTQFYGNSNLQYKGFFRKGIKTGIWKSWYPNGELQEVSHWKNGLKDGKTLTYSLDNKPVQQTEFRNGTMKKAVNFDKSGKKIKPKKKKERKKLLQSLFEKAPEKKHEDVEKEKSTKTGRTTILDSQPPVQAP